MGILVALGLLATGSSVWATTMVRLEEQDLWNVADTILIGRVPLPPQPVAQAGSKVVFSRITILVDEYVAATREQREVRQIDLVQPGGTYQGRTTVVPGMPTFRQDERVLLFLRRNPRTGKYNVVGLSQGKFEIRKEEGTGREYLVPGAAKVNLVPALRPGQPTSLKAVPQAAEPAAPSGEGSTGRQAKRYLDDVVGQIKAYKHLKGGLDQ